MAVFGYRATDREGRVSEGVVEAGGEVAALFEEIQASVDTMSRAPGDPAE